MAYVLHLGSCSAVPLLRGVKAVQGTSPYTPQHQTGPTSWVPVDTCPIAIHHQLPGRLPCCPNSMEVHWSGQIP